MQCGQKKKKKNGKRDRGDGGMILSLQLVIVQHTVYRMSTRISVVQNGKKAKRVMVHAFKY